MERHRQKKYPRRTLRLLGPYSLYLYSFRNILPHTTRSLSTSSNCPMSTTGFLNPYPPLLYPAIISLFPPAVFTHILHCSSPMSSISLSVCVRGCFGLSLLFKSSSLRL